MEVRNPINFRWASTALFVLGVMNVQGQEIIRSYTNVWSPGAIGGFDSIGDIDVDSFPDFIVGEANLNNGTIERAGRVTVLSGKTGTTLFSYLGTSDLDRLGSVISGMGDVSGDGIPDFMALRVTTQKALQHIWSGKDGSLIADLEVFAANDTLGDINGDGTLDFVQTYWSFLGPGKVTALSGGTFEEVYSISTPPSSVHFGFSISTLGDVDGDGASDFAVGAPGGVIDRVCVPGEVFAYSGRDGRPLYALAGEGQNSFFGARLAGAGDLDGDGVGDLAVAAKDCCGEFCDYGGPGRIYFFNGRNGAGLGVLDGHSLGPFTVDLGYELIAVGDLDGNGYGDVLASYTFGPTRTSLTRYLVAIDGGTRSEIYSFINPFGQVCVSWGFGVSAAGDANGDDFPDFFASGSCFGPPTNRIDLVSGAPKGVRVLGEPCGSLTETGHPRIGATGVPLPGRVYRIHLSRVEPGAQAFLLLGRLVEPRDLLRASVSANAGCTVLVRTMKVHFTEAVQVRPGEGVGTVHVSIPNDPALIGTKFYAQWLVEQGTGWEATRALQIEIQEPCTARISSY